MRNWMSSLFRLGKESSFFTSDINAEGIDFHCEEKLFNSIKTGKADEFITAQFVALKMLVEEGRGEEIPNGFIIDSEVISSLDEDTQQLLKLPQKWNGRVEANIKGTTSGDVFKVELSVTSPSDRLTQAYDIVGPSIQFGDSSYILPLKLLWVFTAKHEHDASDRLEFANLKYLHCLQQAKENGANLSLAHFNKLNIHVPDKVAVEAELDSSGNLILTPNTGQSASCQNMQGVLGQMLGEDSKTIKVGDEIILFDEQKAKAIREIISNRTIPKNQVQQFLETPSAFLDASLVDLDVGFALRVKGATRFKHAYFGETDESGIDWFGQSHSSTILPISSINKAIKTKEDFLEIEKIVEDARATGASEIQFDGKSYDIGSQSEVNEALTKLRAKFEGSGEEETEEPDVEPTPSPEPDPEPDIDDTPIVLDIELNDDTLESPSEFVEQALHDVLYKPSLDWANHKREPFEHQKLGVSWILGLEDKARVEEHINGALMADDMGLGKTFMSLSAIEHYYRICEEQGETCRPSLVVAPLSLLENWKDEVEETFHHSPFRDIIILQTDGELNRFRSGGVEIRNNTDSDGFELRYSLKFGEKHGSQRLDLPKRLVITTYQTLRDYQFSLSQIDWGLVVFDEAQNTKNPNALATRAAKGLKAKFKLLATGTPVENSLADFWCLMDTACPGYLDSYQEFRKTYILPILQAAGDEIESVRANLGRKLREKVGALMLRRVKEDNIEGLPNKRMFVGIDTGLLEEADNVDWKYDRQLDAMMAGYQLKVYEGTIEAQNSEEDSHVLTTLMRLRDSSLHPRLTDGGRLDSPTSKKELRQLFDESVKMAKTIEVLESIKQRQQKCIIFAVNKRLQRFLSVSLGIYFGLGPLHVINGDAKAVTKRKGTLSRKSMITDFESKEGFNIIIMSPVAAGVGLTVVGANNVIHFERHWNPAKEAQATDRVYRIGQKQDVNIYVPILHHPEFESFDVNLHKLLSQKSMLKDAVVTTGEVMPSPSGADKTTLSGDTILKFEDIEKLSWRQFEALCVELLSRHYASESAWLTKDGADYGADGVLAYSENAIVIQAKHKKGDYKGYSAVQEVAQSARLYEDKLGRKVTEMIFITNATRLSKQAKKLAQKLSVKIFDGNEIERLIQEYPLTFSQVSSRLNKKRLVI